MLEARRSAAAEVEEVDEAVGGSDRPVGGCTGLSTGGVAWRRRAAAVEALVRGPMLEKSLSRRFRLIRQFQKKKKKDFRVCDSIMQTLFNIFRGRAKGLPKYYIS